MADALRRFFLLYDWATRGRGVGPSLFAFGKAIGMLGRTAAFTGAILLTLGCALMPDLLLPLSYAIGPLALLWLALEALARALMLAGNWLTLHGGGHR